MDLQFAFEFELGRSQQILAQNLLFDFELMFVAGMLVMASSAPREITALWLDAVRGGLDDLFDLTPGKAGLLPSDRGLDFFLGKYKWDEDGLAPGVLVFICDC